MIWRGHFKGHLMTVWCNGSRHVHFASFCSSILHKPMIIDHQIISNYILWWFKWCMMIYDVPLSSSLSSFHLLQGVGWAGLLAWGSAPHHPISPRAIATTTRTKQKAEQSAAEEAIFWRIPLNFSWRLQAYKDIQEDPELAAEAVANGLKSESPWNQSWNQSWNILRPRKLTLSCCVELSAEIQLWTCLLPLDLSLERNSSPSGKSAKVNPQIMEWKSPSLRSGSQAQRWREVQRKRTVADQNMKTATLSQGHSAIALFQSQSLHRKVQRWKRLSPESRCRCQCRCQRHFSSTDASDSSSNQILWGFFLKSRLGFRMTSVLHSQSWSGWEDLIRW